MHRIVSIATGRTISATVPGFDGRWDWISNAVADHCDCQPDDVDEIETDDGDVITARGEPVARVEF